MTIRNYLDIATRFHNFEQPLPVGLHHRLMRGDITVEAARSLSRNTQLTDEQREALLRFKDQQVTTRVLINSTRTFTDQPVATIVQCLNMSPTRTLTRAIEAYRRKPRKTLRAALLHDKRLRGYYNSKQAREILEMATTFDATNAYEDAELDTLQFLTRSLSYEDAHALAKDPATTPETLSYLLARPFSPRNAARIASRILTEADRVTDQAGYQHFVTSSTWYARTYDRSAYQDMMREKPAKEIPADEAPYLLAHGGRGRHADFVSVPYRGDWANVMTSELEDFETFIDIIEFRPTIVGQHAASSAESWSNRTLKQLHLRTDIPTALRRRAFELLEEHFWSSGTRFGEFARDVDPREIFPPDSYEIEYWHRNLAPELLDTGGWDIFGGPEKFAQNLDAKLRVQARNLLIRINRQPAHPVVLANLPFSRLTDLKDDQWMLLASKMLDEAVGDNPAAQDAIGVLISNGWDSTFGELLNVARAVSV